MKTCPDCNGDGVVDKGTDDEQRCPTCGGSGFVPDNDDDNEEVLNTSHYDALDIAAALHVGNLRGVVIVTVLTGR